MPGLRPDKAKNSQETPQAKGPVEPAGPVDPLTQGQWQRSSDLTPEAWQQQVDQQLRQKEAEQQAESWASRNAPRHGPHQTDPIFKESNSQSTEAAQIDFLNAFNCNILVGPRYRIYQWTFSG